MAAKLVVGLFCTRETMRVRLLSDRLNGVADAIEATAKCCGEVGKELQGYPLGVGDVKGVFVAPEYLVSTTVSPSKEDLASAERIVKRLQSDYAIDYMIKDAIVTMLSMHSSIRGWGLICIPGTVAYRKQMQMEGEDAQRGRKRALKTLQKLQGVENLQGVRESLDTGASSYNRDVIEMRTMSQRPGKFAADKTYIFKNKAYVFFNGKEEYVYSKKAGFKELQMTEAKRDDEYFVFAPGSKSCRQVIKNIPFGFEICLDHASGALAKECTPPDDAGPLIHVICSASVDNYGVEHAPVRPGGWVLHASTARLKQMIRRKRPDGLSLADCSHVAGKQEIEGGKWLRAEELGTGVLDLFTITIDN
jgi:hypothetical protein